MRVVHQKYSLLPLNMKLYNIGCIRHESKFREGQQLRVLTGLVKHHGSTMLGCRDSS
jgi:hypothetical protein